MNVPKTFLDKQLASKYSFVIQLSIHPQHNNLIFFESKTMESLKYCLVLATLIGFVVANPTPKKIGSFKTPHVEGTVFFLNETTLKIQDYEMKSEGELVVIS